MSTPLSRRSFLAGLGATAVAGSSAVSTSSVVSGFSRTQPAATSMRLGYAAITWGGDDERAAREIAEVGFTAIQVRGSAFERYGKAPDELKDLLARHKLTFAVLSSGNLGIEPAVEASELAMHIEHAKFLRAAGGRTLQIIDERPKRALVAADYARLGRLLTAVGQRTAELGVETVYHHHMNSIGEKPHEVDAVLETIDPKAVGILFDIAHYQQGGGDPVGGHPPLPRSHQGRAPEGRARDRQGARLRVGGARPRPRGRERVRGGAEGGRLQGLGDHRAGQGAGRQRIAEGLSAREQAVRDGAARAQRLTHGS